MKSLLLRIWSSLDDKTKDSIQSHYVYDLVHKLFDSKDIKKRIKHDNESVIICSIPKSGTNAMRLFLANYINILINGGGGNGPVFYDDMNDSLFPNCRDYYFSSGYKKSWELPDWVPFLDVVYGHSVGNDLLRSSSPLIFLYRNPLDYIISRYFYTYKFRQGREDIYSHPREAIDDLLPEYLDIYKKWMDINNKRNNMICVSYEQMMDMPFYTFQTVIHFIGLPFNAEALNKAIDFSSINRTKKYEEENGPIHVPDNFTGKFARDGAVGQWKKYFNKSDLEYIRSVMSSHGVSLNDFNTVSQVYRWCDV